MARRWVYRQFQPKKTIGERGEGGLVDQPTHGADPPAFMQADSRIWIEVDDLIRYFDGSVAPTGVARVQLEIIPRLLAMLPGRVGLIRIGEKPGALRIVLPAEFAQLTDTSRSLVQAAKTEPMLSLLRFGRWSRRRFADAVNAVVHRSDAARFAGLVAPGDVLLSLGGAWSNPGFAGNVADLKQRLGLRFGLLIHDILPLSHPDLVAPSAIPGFKSWLTSVTPLLDVALSPSRATADSVEAWAAGQNMTLPPISVVPFGDGFGHLSASPAGLRDCVLYVSTIEIRKNHVLLYRIWRKLLERHPRESVPDLVFAGKFGWMVEDLHRDMKASGNLGGKIVVMQNLTDGELSALYRRSLFTVFPSFAEGWGLPIAESLRHGRHCIASNATSMPEVGGDFVDYHAPDDEDAAYGLVERAIFDEAYRAEREQRLETAFTPRSWDDTAKAVLGAAGVAA